MKEELWPKSGRYISSTRFKTFKMELHNNPVTDAINLAVILFGTNDVALQLFRGTGFGLQAALGPDVISDIIGKWKPSPRRFRIQLSRIIMDYSCFSGWINSFHPVCTNDNRHYVTSAMLIAGFTKRFTYLRKKAEEPGERSSGKGDCPTDLVFEDPVDYD